MSSHRAERPYQPRWDSPPPASRCLRRGPIRGLVALAERARDQASATPDEYVRRAYLTLAADAAREADTLAHGRRMILRGSR